MSAKKPPRLEPRHPGDAGKLDDNDPLELSVAVREADGIPTSNGGSTAHSIRKHVLWISLQFFGESPRMGPLHFGAPPPGTFGVRGGCRWDLTGWHGR